MSSSEKLIAMMSGLNMPITVSSSNGAIRSMQQRIGQVRDGQVQSMGSCNPPWSTWGN